MRWVWLEAVAWAEARWTSGSGTIGQLVTDLGLLLDDMHSSPTVDKATVAHLREELHEVATRAAPQARNDGQSVEVRRLLQQVSDLAYRSR